MQVTDIFYDRQGDCVQILEETDLRKVSNTGLNITLQNIRSFTKNMDNFVMFLSQVDESYTEIMGLTET